MAWTWARGVGWRSGAAARFCEESSAELSSATGNPSSATAASARPPAAPSKPQGFLSEFWDAVSVRTVSLIIGILLLQRGDFHGLTGYYLLIGWIVGGYLVAALLGVASDGRAPV